MAYLTPAKELHSEVIVFNEIITTREPRIRTNYQRLGVRLGFEWHLYSSKFHACTARRRSFGCR